MAKEPPTDRGVGQNDESSVEAAMKSGTTMNLTSTSPTLAYQRKSLD